MAYVKEKEKRWDSGYIWKVESTEFVSQGSTIYYLALSKLLNFLES
jgi:hypothetical protein